MKNTLVLLLLSISVYAQKNINNYKYIVVPNQMESFNEADKYQTSSLTKFLFNKNGYIAFLSNDDMPTDLALNKCLALRAILEDGSGMFATKVTLVLKDCNNEIVFKSEEGKSKIKEYKKAYQEAVRKTFSAIKRLNYSYQPVVNERKSRDFNVSVNRDKNIEVAKKAPLKENANISYKLIAEKNISGYNLKDSNDKTVYTLLSTSNPNVFIVKDLNGVLLKSEEGFWSVQYYKDGALKMEVVKVKF
ncbi:hypothetical protein EV195_10219 [Tenacibaculum skagerrakense]|uniref:Uncharacterized protein n=1 Tax=Tenacibaculum skagerrakense TaxID=186571 RepID=A0A4R2NYT3_9FLAO|nr:hypothetical protein [Tenacibaculum skagerrakense]TCP26681.1 hypothetical protein EV195_10219 [Tenacibaculum skagerrakense]